MERLTERSLDYCTQMCPDEKMFSCAFYKDDQAERCLIANMYDRLAAYEDTGLEPEEIESRKEKWNAMTMRERLDSVAKPAQLFDPSLTLEQLKRLDYYDNAEQEGRLIVLPCKVGDTVYKPLGKNEEILPIKIQWFETNNYGWCACGTYPPRATYAFRFADLGKTWFTDRAEAEKAMEVREDA